VKVWVRTAEHGARAIEYHDARDAASSAATLPHGWNMRDTSPHPD